jgi:hypothetical protein
VPRSNWKKFEGWLKRLKEKGAISTWEADKI